jgi:copper transport protein
MRLRGAVLAILFLVASTGMALAHAALVSSDPADGAVLATAPGRLMLTFNEPVSPTVLSLTGADGKARPLATYHREDTTLVIDAPAGLARGSYALNWRVISADGHPVSGASTFSVGAASGGAFTGGHQGDDFAVAIAFWLAKVIVYVGLFAGIGGVAFGAFVAPVPSAAAKVARTAVVAGLVAAIVSLGLEGIDALGRGLASLADPDVWAAGWQTSYGTTVIVACAAFVIALLGERQQRWRRPTAFVALAGVGLALAASGHASAASPQWLMRPLVFVHTVAITWWLGALIPLAAIIHAGGEARRDALARFTRFIPYAVVLLIVSGPILAWVQVEEVSALWSTAYGRVLLAKLTLVVILLLVAAVNRWWLTVPAERGDPGAGRRLRIAIAFEVALALGILGVVAIWRFTPPPRALIAAAAPPAMVHLHTDKAMVEVTVAPGRAGRSTASVYVMTGDFAPLAAKEVTLEFSDPAAGIEPIRKAARDGGDGRWTVDGLVLPVAGMWHVEVGVLVSDFDLTQLSGDIAIRP